MKKGNVKTALIATLAVLVVAAAGVWAMPNSAAGNGDMGAMMQSMHGGGMQKMHGSEHKCPMMSGDVDWDDMAEHHNEMHGTQLTPEELKAMHSDGHMGSK